MLFQSWPDRIPLADVNGWDEIRTGWRTGENVDARAIEFTALGFGFTEASARADECVAGPVGLFDEAESFRAAVSEEDADGGSASLGWACGHWE